jgi:hypothetical protein
MLMHSMVGGDRLGGYPARGVWLYDGEEYWDAQNVFDDVDLRTEYENNLDPFHDIQQQLFDAFDVGDELRRDISNHGEEDDEEGDISMEEISSNLDQLEQLCSEATKTCVRWFEREYHICNDCTHQYGCHSWN